MKLMDNLKYFLCGILLLLFWHSSIFAQNSRVTNSAASQSFVNVTDSTGLGNPGIGIGFGAADFNRDSNIDIYLVNQGANVLYQNPGRSAWQFSDITAQANVEGSSNLAAAGVAPVDYNNDGFIDIFTFSPPELFGNLGDNSFENATGSARLSLSADISAAIFFDYDNDGDLDAFFTTADARYSNRLFENLGAPAWEFIERTSIAKVTSYSQARGCIHLDYNNDGWQDIFIINQNKANELYENQGNDTFRNVADDKGVDLTGVFTGASTADYDNDGDLDLYLTVSTGPNQLLQNSGSPDFSFSGAQAGIGSINNGLASAWGDYDNDGDLDLFVCNPYGYSYLYQNTGNGNFNNVAPEAGLSQSGGTLANFLDYNNDGNQDIYIVNSTGANKLYKNSGTEQNWIKIQLSGIQSNSFGVGARIIVYTADGMQIREINGQNLGAFSQNNLPEHFGLGKTSQIDSIAINWSSGTRMRLTDIPANQLLVIHEDEMLPQSPTIISPTHNSALNTNPLFEWTSPIDPNGDSLQFRFEITGDSLFQESQIFDSWVTAAGFEPNLPVASGTGTVRFVLPDNSADGVYWWRVFAYDGIGLSAATAPSKFTVDTVIPVNPAFCFESNGAQSDVWQNFNNEPQFLLDGASDEGTGIAGYLAYWGDDPEGTSTSFFETNSLTFPAVTDGKRFLRVRAVDYAQNQAQSWATLFIHKFDGTPPHGATASSVQVSDTVAFYVHWENTASDAGGSGLSGLYAIRRRVNYGPWEDIQTAYKGTALFDHGRHGYRYAYEVAAIDGANNVEAFTGIAETIVFVDTNSVDAEAPPPPYNLHASGASPSPWQNTARFLLTWSQPYDRSGIYRCYYKLSRAPTSNADTSGSAPGLPGLNIEATESYGQWLYLWLEDGRGNRDFARYDSVYLRFDPDPPIIRSEMVTAPDFGIDWFNPNKKTTIDFTIEYAEKVPRILKIWNDTSSDTLKVKPDASAGSHTLEFELLLSPFADGTHNHFAALTDSAGNVTADTVSFLLDGTPPKDSRVSAPDTSNRKTILIHWQNTGTDGSGSGLSGIYDIHFRKDSGDWQTLALKHSDVAIQFTGEHRHSYDFEVAAYDRVGNREPFLNMPEASTWIDTTARMSQVLPERPQLVSPAADSFVNTSHPVLSWRIPDDANNDQLHFRLEISTDSTFLADVLTFESFQGVRGFSPEPPVMPGSGEIQFITLTALVPTSYYWRVTAFDGIAYGLISEIRKFTVDIVFPKNPTSCTETQGTTSNRWQNSHNSPEFEWEGASDVSSGIAGYLLFWGRNPKGESSTFIAQTRFKPDAVACGTYYLRIRTRDRAGNVAVNWSTVFIFKYDNIPPTGATASTPAFSQGRTFTVQWEHTAADSGGAGLTGHYDIYSKTDTSDWSAQRVDFYGDSLQLTGAMNTRYYFEVAARDSAGNVEALTGNPETSILVARPNKPPDAPRLQTPADGSFITARAPEFKWTVPEDADHDALHFSIEMSSRPEFEPPKYRIDSREAPDGFSAIPASQPDVAAVKYSFQASLSDGRYWWRVRAHDGLLFGAPSDTFSFTLDSSPPAMTHTPIASVTAGTQIQIAVTIKDSLSGVASKSLLYKQGGWSETSTVKIISESAIIPGDEVTARGVEYAIIAEDHLGNSAQLPENGFYSISVQMGGNGIIKSKPQPTGEAQNAYRMISVPLKLNHPAPADVLQDDLGFYDRKKWRLFSYRRSLFTEFGFTGDFEPGRSFWLILKEGSPEIDSGPGQTVSTATPYTIPVDSASWTMVANPYNFSVPLSALSLANGDEALNIIAYDGKWQIRTDFSELEPWQGYMVKAMSSTNLIIDPRPATEPQSGEFTSLPRPNSAVLWGMQITAHCQAASDQCNYIGIREDAENQWDAYDLFEPPVIGDFVQVRFPHPDWQNYAENYTTDFRSAAKEGHYWDFEAITNINASDVCLRFTEIDSIPAEFEIALIDRQMNVIKDLRTDWTYHYSSGATTASKPLRLIIGSSDFLKANDLGATAMPDDYQLAQNFPNPFNDQTVIRFYLPRQERVQLIIYNILGEEIIRLLDDETRGSGFHSIFWNGGNKSGIPVSSGVYFYLLKTTSGKLNLVRKMVYVR
ncbi:VCBS repeat-containing protein [candidate division KSB1 bacterium]|nr:VCBS repeat-containing protein [candidate division KSB1 bacterium]